MTSIKDYLAQHPLSNNTIRVGISKYALMRPDCINDDDMDCDAGMELELFSMVSNQINVSLDIKFSNVLGCGYQENGTWYGLLGMLYRNEIDVIGNLCTLDQSRFNIEWLQPSWPVLMFKQNFLIKAPEPKYRFNVAAPFHFHVWAGIFWTVIAFVLVFCLNYKVLGRMKVIKSIIHAVMDAISIISATDTGILMFRRVWYLFLFFIGFMNTMYSTLITVAILKPVIIDRPFKTNVDMVKVLYNGEYKLLDYNTPPHVRCYDNETYQLLKATEHIRGHHGFKNPTGNNAISLLLDELLLYPNLVLVRGRYMLRTYLDSHVQRDRFWLIEDEMAGEEWSVYFFGKNFVYQKEFDQALIRMGAAKETLKALYNGLSYQAVESKTIKGTVPDKITMDIHLLSGPLWFYSIGLAAALLCFFFEVLLHKNCSNCNR